MNDMSAAGEDARNIECEQEIAQERYARQVKDLMLNHTLFYEFAGEMNGEQWLSDLLEEMATGKPKGGLKQMADAYREFCEMWLREGE